MTSLASVIVQLGALQSSAEQLQCSAEWLQWQWQWCISYYLLDKLNNKSWQCIALSARISMLVNFSLHFRCFALPLRVSLYFYLFFFALVFMLLYLQSATMFFVVLVSFMVRSDVANIWQPSKWSRLLILKYIVCIIRILLFK